MAVLCNVFLLLLLHFDQLLIEIVYVVWILFEAAFCYRYVIETKNLTLEETAALFDGDEAVENITAATHGDGAVHDEKGSESFITKT